MGGSDIKNERIQYLVMGFDKPYGDNKLVSYQLLEQNRLLNGAVANRLLPIQFPIDKQPKLFDMFCIDTDKNGFNTPGKLIGSFPEKALKVYDFLSNLESFESIRNKRIKIVDDAKESVSKSGVSQAEIDKAIKDAEDKSDINFTNPVECVIEGCIEKYNTKIKTTIKTPSGLSIGIWHHDLVNPFKEIGIGSGDFVRAFGKVKNGKNGYEMNAYIYGIKKYIPVPEVKATEPAEDNTKDEIKKAADIKDFIIKRGLDDCEAAPIPEANVKDNKSSHSNKSNALLNATTSPNALTMPIIPTQQDKEKWFDSRFKNFKPYSFIGKDENEVLMCNFNITFLKSLTIGDKQFYSIRINYVNEDGTCGFIDKDIDNDILYNQSEWNKFISPLSHLLWYEQYFRTKIITEINRELTYCNPYIEFSIKNSDMGWNKEGDRYSTQTVDIFNTEPDLNGEHQTHIGEGTTHFIDGGYSSIKDVRFVEITDDEFKMAMTYLSTKWLKLHPLIPRMTGFAFVSPFASFTAFYVRMVAYFNGETGYGKTGLAKALASFYGNIKDDKQLVSILQSSIPIIADYGHLYKDCIMVLDNFKEPLMTESKIKDVCKYISNYADNQPREVRKKDETIKSRLGRGALIVTGEEITQDASTLRKIDHLKFLEPLDKKNDKIKPNITELQTYTPYFSGVMIRYIKWMMARYGNADRIGEAIVESAKKQTDIGDRMLKMNYVGFSLFLEFMVDNKYLFKADIETMLKAHMNNLMEIDNEKLDSVKNKTTGQKYIDAIKSLIKTNDVQIDGVLHNTYKSTIGRALNNGDIVIYPEAYALIRSKTMHYYELPRDYESVKSQIKSMIINGELEAECNQVKIKHKNEWSITYKPSVFGLDNVVSALSHSSIVKVFNRFPSIWAIPMKSDRVQP